MSLRQYDDYDETETRTAHARLLFLTKRRIRAALDARVPVDYDDRFNENDDAPGGCERTFREEME